MDLWEREKEWGRCGQTSVAIAATAAQVAGTPGHGGTVRRHWRYLEAAARDGR